MHLHLLLGSALAATALGVAGLAACRNERPAAPAPRAPVDEDRIFQQLAILAVGAPLDPPALAAARAAAPTTGARIDALAGQLVEDPRFAPSLATGLLNRWLDTTFSDGSVLQHTASAAGAPPIYYLRAPCKPSAAARVHPWWDPPSTVLVCPDSYRPEVAIYEAKAEVACNGLAAQVPGERAPICGCGPNLLRCYRDQPHQDEVLASMANEIRDTFTYLVQHDQPIATLFTTKATVRDRNAEAVYRRWRVLAGEPATVLTDLMTAPWPRADAPTPRVEARAGEHAGILTAAAMEGMGTPRDRVKLISEKMWCIEPKSVRATTHAILELGATDLRAGEGWRKLAAMPVCNTCHARLDYGMQFFSGFGDVRRRIGYDPRLQQAGKGPLFIDDIHDHRGDVELSPAGFAAAAVAQPEFARCMTSQIATLVFGVDATPEDRRALEAAYEASRGDLKIAIRAGLRQIGRDLEQRAVPPPAAPPAARPAASPSASLALSAGVRGIVEQRCADCHDASDASDDKPALSGATVPREVAERMLASVAFGAMPKAGVIAPAERARFTGELADALWAPGTPANRAARDFFVDQQRGAPLHDVQRLVNVIDGGAGAATDDHWEVVRSDSNSSPVLTFDLSPGMAGVIALEALAACKKAGHASGDELAACLDRAIDPKLIVRDH